MKQKKENNHLYLIDGHAFCYRAFYAIRELSNSKGMPTNAIYGVVTMLKKIIKEHSPSMMAFAFDSEGKTVRHEKYDQYKIQRKPMPEDLSSQISAIIEVVSAYNIPVFQIQGYEADDIIATIATKAENMGTNVTIVTADKDALQLVDDHIRVLSPGSFGDKIYSIKEVKEKYGVSPAQMQDFMALAGDTSDNIPGVKGIGPVTAGKLINEYGNLSAVFNNIDKIDKSTLKEKLKTGREMAEMSLELVKLDRGVPVDFDIRKTAISEADNEKLISLFHEFEFDKLLRDIVSPDEKKVDYRIISSDEEYSDLVDIIRKNNLFSFSFAVKSPGTICGLALSAEAGKACFISFDMSEGLPSRIKEIFEDTSITRVSCDIKKDFHSLRENGLMFNSGFFDVMLADYILDPSKNRHDLMSMAMRSLGYTLGNREGSGTDDSGQGKLDLGEGAGYFRFCEESDIALRLYHKQYPVLKKKKLFSLFKDVEMPLSEVLAVMESTGVGVDLKYLEKKSSELEKKLERLTSRIHELAGRKFNINSTKQLRAVLFDELHLPKFKKTKTGASTDESVLKKLSSMHELPATLLKYRELNKLKTGYYDSIKNLISSDGRLHANFNQAVTATDRLSSSEPNLQNIPVKTKKGREIRKAFVPYCKDNILLSADYSQVELRILAHLSEDRDLIAAFRQNKDIHRFTASLIFDCAEEDVTKQMRSTAKTVNFGIVYGMSAFRLSKDLDIPVKEAGDFIEAYFDRYKNIKKFMDETITFAKKKGYVTTILKRRRYIPEINSTNERVKGFSERAAINTPVQGSAADLIKLAMLRCFETFKGSDIKMLIQVHDELVFEVPGKKLSATAEKIRDIMESVIDLNVPLKVDIESGPNWADLNLLDI
jgi:DNA polymerase-1